MAIQINPKEGSAYSSRGFAYNKLLRYEEAINDFSEAIQLYPNDV